MELTTLAAQVIERAIAGKQRLVTVESCTGGLIAHALTSISGSSAVFWAGLVTYHNDIKHMLVGVPQEVLESHGAVSAPCAAQMAAGGIRTAQATLSVSVTGIAGPSGGSPEKPVGTVCIGLATKETTTARRYTFSFGKRLMNKRIFAMTALDVLRRSILKVSPL